MILSVKYPIGLEVWYIEDYAPTDAVGYDIVDRRAVAGPKKVCVVIMRSDGVRYKLTGHAVFGGSAEFRDEIREEQLYFSQDGALLALNRKRQAAARPDARCDSACSCQSRLTAVEERIASLERRIASLEEPRP